jgi:hypothetical protein
LYSTISYIFGGYRYYIEDKNKNYHNDLHFTDIHNYVELECLKKLIEIVGLGAKQKQQMKFIETNRQYAIECDNTNCLYRIKNTGQCTKQYIDEQCPSCGENLLTLQDYLDDKKLMKLINWVN